MLPALPSGHSRPTRKAQSTTRRAHLRPERPLLLCSASSWLAYGVLVADDAFVYVPNGLGCAAALLQLSLFARFGIYKGDDSKAAE